MEKSKGHGKEDKKEKSKQQIQERSKYSHTSSLSLAQRCRTRKGGREGTNLVLRDRWSSFLRSFLPNKKIIRQTEETEEALPLFLFRSPAAVCRTFLEIFVCLVLAGLFVCLL
mmetsp:Transcript_14100/g.28277  ORF Transcript_14100/g.28277 Transcript_14100/m.28277 type:complete len:113 (-) Transcript_14100:212-550(-)